MPYPGKKSILKTEWWFISLFYTFFFAFGMDLIFFVTKNLIDFHALISVISKDSLLCQDWSQPE
ncbi:hypothetical protein ACFE6N_22155 [Pedobacter sp. BG31]